MKNEAYRSALRTLWRRAPWILGATALAALAAVGRELLFPPQFAAEQMLMVSGLAAGGDAVALVPQPLSPKAYEHMLTSAAVLGRTIERLEKDGAFGADGPPAIEDFSALLSVKTEIVDETSRPVNYSPLIRVSARGETAEQAVAIVNTWAETATEVAQRASSVRLSAPALMLTRHKEEYEKEVEAVWKLQAEEQAQWNTDVLQRTLSNRVDLLNELEHSRNEGRRKLEIARKRLEEIAGDLTARLETQSGQYAGEADTLRAETARELGENNLDALALQMGRELDLVHSLETQQLDLTREIKGMEERLAKVRGALEKEPLLLELGRAPSETAWWISGAENPKTLAELQGKVMVSQEINTAHQELKKEENEAVATLAQKQAEMSVIAGQLEAAKTRHEALKALFAEHKMTQARLSNDLDIAEKLYSNLRTDEKTFLIQEERERTLEARSLEAELAETERQIEAAKAEVADLQRSLAEHTVAQIRLKTLESQASSIFNDIARTERQTLAALGVASGAEGQEDRPVGLNRMTLETYATEDRGLLGKKGRVLLVTLLAFMLSAAYAYLKHDGLPRFRAWMEAFEAADKRKGK
ncbi:MAG: hypothetical protein GXY15_08125 [Candidatus Hydrogenedentes bacterium]|nr:hypothetical protein [Candidatus Hydrogenedentota bacterium]